MAFLKSDYLFFLLKYTFSGCTCFPGHTCHQVKCYALSFSLNSKDSTSCYPSQFPLIYFELENDNTSSTLTELSEGLLVVVHAYP